MKNSHTPFILVAFLIIGFLFLDQKPEVNQVKTASSEKNDYTEKKVATTNAPPANPLSAPVAVIKTDNVLTRSAEASNIDDKKDQDQVALSEAPAKKNTLVQDAREMPAKSITPEVKSQAVPPSTVTKMPAQSAPTPAPAQKIDPIKPATAKPLTQTPEKHQIQSSINDNTTQHGTTTAPQAPETQHSSGFVGIASIGDKAWLQLSDKRTIAVTKGQDVAGLGKFIGKENNQLVFEKRTIEMQQQ